MPSSIPGGSSSGSAVAVAARLVDFAMGEFSLLAYQVIIHSKMLFLDIYSHLLAYLFNVTNNQLLYFVWGFETALLFKPGNWKVAFLFFVCLCVCVLFGLLQG